MNRHTRSTSLCSKCNATIVTIDKTSPPALYDQLRTLHLASETEVAQIKVLVNDIDKDLESCDAELESLNHTLAELTALRARLQRVRDDHAALLAPVRKLPVELLLHTFSFLCVHRPGLSITTDIYRSKFDAMMPTLNIARTCSQWRKIALANPYLWSNIVVDLGWRPWNVQGLVDLYLERSKPAPLTLRIEAKRVDGNFDLEVDDDDHQLQDLASDSWKLFRTLLDEKPRWLRASFDLSQAIYHWVDERAYDPVYEDSLVLNLAPGKLEHLEMNWSGDTDEALIPFFAHFKTAFNLKTLHIKRFVSFSLPFDQLVAIKLLEDDPISIQGLVVSCPRLKELEVAHSWRTYTSGAEITSQSLQTVSLTFESTQTVGKLLSLLHLPNLTTLTLRMREYSNPKPKHEKKFVKNLKAMLQRSPRLCDLTVEGHILSDSALIEILSEVPSLKSLALLPHRYYGDLYTDTLFKALHIPSTSQSATTPSLVPQLVKLKLEFSESTTHLRQGKPTLDGYMADPVKIVSMLESRRNTLRHFEFHAATGESYEALENLQRGGAHWERLCALHADGLMVTIVFTRTSLFFRFDLDAMEQDLARARDSDSDV